MKPAAAHPGPRSQGRSGLASQAEMEACGVKEGWSQEHRPSLKVKDSKKLDEKVKQKPQ